MKHLFITTILMGVCAGIFASPIIEEDPSFSAVPNPDEYSYYDKEIDESEYPADYIEYRKAIINTRDMIYNHELHTMANKKGLNLLNVTWEDTGRYENSSVGPNISDMTIQVHLEDPIDQSAETFLMPVLRYPNFEDLSTDISPSDFTLLVGNEKGEELQRISLRDFLSDMRSYLSFPEQWEGTDTSMLAPRDEKVLVSAQACFLPVPKKDIATFNPVLFNYQSYQNNPAVLTILVTREGTSVTIIDNVRDSFSDGGVWGQRLFFNRNGERASLTGQRMSDFEANPDNTAELEAATPSVGNEKGLNMVLMIQVPLKFEPMYRYEDDFMFGMMDDMMVMESAAMPMEEKEALEDAVIGSGEAEGAFTEIDNLKIERDPNFPVRVTVQFYKATSTGDVSQAEIGDIYNQIQRVYEQGDYVSSLVTGGKTGRITEYAGTKVQPANWWADFWKRYEKNTGYTREEAIEWLIKHVGPGYIDEPVSDLYLRDTLKDIENK